MNDPRTAIRSALLRLILLQIVDVPEYHLRLCQSTEAHDSRQAYHGRPQLLPIAGNVTVDALIEASVSCAENQPPKHCV
jgi:hypothetical protein